MGSKQHEFFRVNEKPDCELKEENQKKLKEMQKIGMTKLYIKNKYFIIKRNDEK